MEFKKYQHLERYGTTEVEGIDLGKCYLFSKIDGTNASLWWDNGIQAGSRNRQLALDNDNAGFYQWAVSQGNIERFFRENPSLRLYGEWLVPHSLKTYHSEAWRNFYVFDVQNIENDVYIPYDDYKELMDEYEIGYIPPQKIIINPTYDDIIFQLQQNQFLIEDGKGVGEGLVIKNYDFVNKYGRQTWAKIVTSEFKEKHNKEMGAPIVKNNLLEEEIAEKYVTLALCEKVYAKIENEEGFTSKKIPQLLNTVYYDVVREDTWNFIKEHKNPTINFRTLQLCVFKEVKNKLPNIFGV